MGALHLRKFTSLTVLNVSGCTLISDQAARMLLSALPRIVDLELVELLVTDTTICCLPQYCPNVSTLNLMSCPLVTVWCLPSLLKLARLKNLGMCWWWWEEADYEILRQRRINLLNQPD